MLFPQIQANFRGSCSPLTSMLAEPIVTSFLGLRLWWFAPLCQTDAGTFWRIRRSKVRSSRWPSARLSSQPSAPIGTLSRRPRSIRMKRAWWGHEFYSHVGYGFELEGRRGQGDDNRLTYHERLCRAVHSDAAMEVPDSFIVFGERRVNHRVSEMVEHDQHERPHEGRRMPFW